jgi:protein involved in polysaccharide export with SLBB domain
MQRNGVVVRTGLLAGIVLMVFLAGCAGVRQGPPVRTSFVEFTPEQVSLIEAEDVHSYQIQAADVLRVVFSNEPNLNRDPVLVLPDGSVTLVGIEPLRIQGLTVVEADSAITQAYSREYRDPQISVLVLESKGRMVYVMGQVRQPGLVELPYGGLGVAGAVARAGGFTVDAAKEGSVLVRVTDAGYMVQEIDLSNFQDVTMGELATIQLQPFDVIYVPRSRIGDFSYFAKSVLSGLVNVTRIAADVRYLSDANAGRY